MITVSYDYQEFRGHGYFYACVWCDIIQYGTLLPWHPWPSRAQTPPVETGETCHLDHRVLRRLPQHAHWHTNIQTQDFKLMWYQGLPLTTFIPSSYYQPITNNNNGSVNLNFNPPPLPPLLYLWHFYCHYNCVCFVSNKHLMKLHIFSLIFLYLCI